MKSEVTMEFGIILPHFGSEGGTDKLVRAATFAESLGFDSVWVRDNLYVSSFIREHGGTRETGYFLDPLITLAALSRLTEKIKLGTAVLVPHRHPLKVAHELATLSHFSRGRVIAGIGLGADKNQFNSLGLPYGKRRILVKETMDICRAVWSREDVSFSGDIFEFKDVSIIPRPQRPIPFWHGGENWETVDFTAEHCDGWLPSRLVFARLEQRISHLKNNLPASKSEDFTFGAIPLTAIAQTRSEATEHLNAKLLLEEARRRSENPDLTLEDLDGFLICGTPRQIRDHVATFASLGVGHLVFDLRTNFGGLEQSLTLLARDVIPGFR